MFSTGPYHHRYVSSLRYLLMQRARAIMQEMPFPDGDPPPAAVVDRWLELCQKVFSKDDKSTIAVHCVAGLGRCVIFPSIVLQVSVACVPQFGIHPSLASRAIGLRSWWYLRW